MPIMISIKPSSAVNRIDITRICDCITNGHNLDPDLRTRIGSFFLDHVISPVIEELLASGTDMSKMLDILVEEFNSGINDDFLDSLGAKKALSGSPQGRLVDLNSLFSQFEDIRDTSSRMEKEEIIEDILNSSNSEVFLSICRFVYDPFRKINAKVSSSMLDMVDDIDLFDEDDDEEILDDASTWSLFTSVLDLMESGKLKGKSAKHAIISFFKHIKDEYIEWFSMILNKKLKIGIGRATVDKYIPSIPKFSVQLCKKYKGDELDRPYMVQPKVDGLRAVIGRINGHREVLSRNGKPLFNVDELLEACDELCEMLGSEYVFDGELYAGKWADSISITRRSVRGHKNAASLNFYVFDAIPLKEWAQSRCELNLLERDTVLQVAVEALANPRIIHLPSIVSDDREEVIQIASTYAEDGWEGVVLKDPSSYYNYKRDDSWMKFKFVEEVDVEIVGVKYGWHNSLSGGIIDEDDPRSSDLGNEWEPVVRSIIIEYNNIETSVGSGLDLAQRYEFYDLAQKGDLVGTVAEIAYQSVTPDGKLLFPRFLRLREDKSI